MLNIPVCPTISTTKNTGIIQVRREAFQPCKRNIHNSIDGDAHTSVAKTHYDNKRIIPRRIADKPALGGVVGGGWNKDATEHTPYKPHSLPGAQHTTYTFPRVLHTSATQYGCQHFAAYHYRQGIVTCRASDRIPVIKRPPALHSDSTVTYRMERYHVSPSTVRFNQVLKDTIVMTTHQVILTSRCSTNA